MSHHAMSKLKRSVATSFVRPFFVFALLLCGWAGPSNASELIIDIDEAHLVRLDNPSAEIIVGNPSIADVSVQSAKILVVTGKTFGLTNIIVLDAAGNEILNRKVSVRADSQRIVTLRKGVERYSLHCTPVCQSPMVVGDNATYFDVVSRATKTKFSAAETALQGGKVPQ